jgi:hypothetical protein
VTKRSDMSSRYAAAHARREQRKREISSREYLPLAEESVIQHQSNTGGLGDRLRTSGRGTAVLTSRLPAIDYSYLRSDLIRTFVLAGSLFIVMIALSFVIK